MPNENTNMILKHADQPGYTRTSTCYLRHGGYEVLKSGCQSDKTLPDWQNADCAGTNPPGSDAPVARARRCWLLCGLKWSFVDRKSGKPIYLI